MSADAENQEAMQLFKLGWALLYEGKMPSKQYQKRGIFGHSEHIALQMDRQLEAAMCFQEAMHLGHPGATYMFATAILDRWAPISKDYFEKYKNEALDWLLWSAERYYDAAEKVGMIHLGYFSDEPKYKAVRRDPEKGVELLLKCQTDIALGVLSDQFLRGTLVPRDIVKSMAYELARVSRFAVTNELLRLSFREPREPWTMYSAYSERYGEIKKKITLDQLEEAVMLAEALNQNIATRVPIRKIVADNT